MPGIEGARRVPPEMPAQSAESEEARREWLREDVNARRPRVLLVGPMPPTKGGVTTFMLNLMASDLRRAFEFVPFTTSRPPKRNVIDNWGYGSILRGGVGRVAAGILITLWHLAKFPFRLALGRIDLVQIQASDFQAFWESALYALMARLLRRPVVFRIGGAFDLFYQGSPAPIRRWIGEALRLPQIVVAQSEIARNHIRAAGRQGPIVILPNWVREGGFAEVERATKNDPTFLFIAGIEARRKGVEEVLTAVRMLNDRGCPAKFHFLAVTPALAEGISALRLANVLAMEGPVGRERVLAAMRHADVLLLPSRGEGFPNSLIEAMAAGMAAVVTPVGAVPEIVAEGGALTVPVGDGMALASAIERLALDEDLRWRLGREGRETVRRCYTAAALPRLSDAYAQLLRR